MRIKTTYYLRHLDIPLTFGIEAIIMKTKRGKHDVAGHAAGE